MHMRTSGRNNLQQKFVILLIFELDKNKKIIIKMLVIVDLTISRKMD